MKPSWINKEGCDSINHDLIVCLWWCVLFYLQKLATIQNTEVLGGNGEGILGAHLQSAKVLMICWTFCLFRTLRSVHSGWAQYILVIGVFPTQSRTFTKFNEFSESENYWSMNWAQFKDPVSHMRLAGAVVASWSLTQERPANSVKQLGKIHWQKEMVTRDVNGSNGGRMELNSIKKELLPSDIF